MGKLDIKIQSRKMLKPSVSTLDNLRRLKLSLFDQLAHRTYVPILFNYLPSSSDHETISYDKLEKSLAETLTKFYPFAGKFGKDDPLISIDCNDEGVEYVQTKVKADDGDGIQIIVSLKENDTTEFERDPYILSSTSKLAFHSFG